MKLSGKLLGVAVVTILIVSLLSGCSLPQPETVPVDKSIPTMQKLQGNKISFEHEVGGSTITTSYDLGDYKLENWRITDSKSINLTVRVKEDQKGTEILVEHIHADLSIKSTDPQLNGLTQDSMDNSYHGTSQDGFLVNKKYSYSNIFAVEGFSKDIIEGWSFYCGDYGVGTIDSRRLTEGNLLKAGTYGSQLAIVYNFIVKNPGDEKYHVESLEDRIIIPTLAIIQAAQVQPTNDKVKE
jgi:hypothetical protein